MRNSIAVKNTELHVALGEGGHLVQHRAIAALLLPEPEQTAPHGPLLFRSHTSLPEARALNRADVPQTLNFIPSLVLFMCYCTRVPALLVPEVSNSSQALREEPGGLAQG